MKIRNKIALIFTLITALMLLVIFSIVYFFTDQYTQGEFFHRLQERAVIAAEAFLKEDELSASIYDEIRKEHLHTLPEEHEYILPFSDIGRLESDAIPEHFPHSFSSQIISEEYAEGKHGDTFYVGMEYRDNQGDFVVVISAVDRYGEAKLNNLLHLLVLVFFCSLGFLYFVGLYYARQVLKPIAQLRKKADGIRASNLNERLETGNKYDELSELAITFNHMLDRLETSFEIQSNFVNNASHELKNPLTAILGEVEVSLKKARSIEEYKSTLQTVEKEATRLNMLVNSLLRLAQTEYDNKGLIIFPVRMDELLLAVHADLDNLKPENKLTLDFSELPEDAEAITIQGNESLLKVAFTNIFDNACKFSGNKKVLVRIRSEKQTVHVVVQDQGLGIPPEELKNIPETFYRATNVRGIAGFGVGLPLAQKIIKMHNGKMTILSEVNKGTEVHVTLPNIGQKIKIGR